MCVYKKHYESLCCILLFYFIFIRKRSSCNQCDKCWCIETPCIIGKKLLNSAVIEEVRLAKYLEYESKKIREEAKQLNLGHCRIIYTKDLIKANCSVKKKFRCIASIEKNILRKVYKGKWFLLNGKNYCSKIHHLNNTSCVDSCDFILLLYLIYLLNNRNRSLC